MSVDTYDYLRGLIEDTGIDANVAAFDALLKHHEDIGKKHERARIRTVLEDKLRVIEEHMGTDGEIKTDRSDSELLKALIQGLG